MQILGAPPSRSTALTLVSQRKRSRAAAAADRNALAVSMSGHVNPAADTELRIVEASGIAVRTDLSQVCALGDAAGRCGAGGAHGYGRSAPRIVGLASRSLALTGRIHDDAPAAPRAAQTTLRMCLGRRG
jgi:hypothetical protein